MGPSTASDSWCISAPAVSSSPNPGPPGPAGELAGLELHAGLDSRFAEFSLTMPAADVEIRCPTDEWRGIEPISLVHRLERRIQHLDATLAEVRSDQLGATQEAEKARTRIGSPFEHENDLHRLQRRQREINEVFVPVTGEAQVEPVSEPSAAERMAARLASQPAPTARGLGR
jgi:hypothetical protein